MRKFPSRKKIIKFLRSKRVLIFAFIIMVLFILFLFYQNNNSLQKVNNVNSFKESNSGTHEDSGVEEEGVVDYELEQEQDDSEPIKFIAIGDSYTEGYGVATDEAWPEVLSANMQNLAYDFALSGKIAKFGWTTSDLINFGMPYLGNYDFNFAILLIGTNDYAFEVARSTFESNIINILDTIQAKLVDKQNMMILTIPDFSLVPGGAKWAKGRDISADIKSWNEFLTSQVSQRGFSVVELYPNPDEMATDPTLILSDDFHPSAKEYQIWVDAIAETFIEILNSNN
jgi:lysophospholipase L1-like esterase